MGLRVGRTEAEMRHYNLLRSVEFGVRYLVPCEKVDICYPYVIVFTLK
jgi:hypothetical protein